MPKVSQQQLEADRVLVEARRARKAAEKQVRILEAQLALRGKILGPEPSSLAENARRYLECLNGTGIVFSDAHFWPGKPSTAYRALLEICAKEQPDFIIANGDIIDGASISRWGPISFADYKHKPTVIQELAVCQQRMRDIFDIVPENCERIWTLGNHDARFEKYIAEHAPEFIGVPGTSLKDHFPDWQPRWSVMVNSKRDPLMIKHRFKGGMYAPKNNVTQAQTHMVTGHLHAQKIMEQTGYRQTLYGVDAGMLDAPYGPNTIHYTEDNPVDWRSGFVVLRFVDGFLRRPQLCTVIDEADGLVEYLGEDMHV